MLDVMPINIYDWQCQPMKNGPRAGLGPKNGERPMRRIISRIAVGLFASGLALTLLAPSASAASIDPGLPQEKAVAQQTFAPDLQSMPGGFTPMSGWLGPCYVSRYPTSAGGWCNGNGPDWAYMAEVRCSNGSWYYNGPYRWAG